MDRQYRCTAAAVVYAGHVGSKMHHVDLYWTWYLRREERHWERLVNVLTQSTTQSQ